MTLSKFILSAGTFLALQGGLLFTAHGQDAAIENSLESVATPLSTDMPVTIDDEDTRIETLKTTTSMAKRANKIRKGDAAAIASTAVSAITGNSAEGEAINANIKNANTLRKIATGNVGSLAKVLIKQNKKNAPTGPSLRKLKKRAAQTTGIKFRNLEISDVKEGDPRTVYKATAAAGPSYWCFVSFDGKKTSDAICSQSGGEVCSPIRKAAGEC